MLCIMVCEFQCLCGLGIVVCRVVWHFSMCGVVCGLWFVYCGVSVYVKWCVCCRVSVCL